MFGHDNQHHDNGAQLPNPDSGLSADDQAQAATAPQVTTNGAENDGYLDDMSPAANPTSSDPNDAATAPAPTTVTPTVGNAPAPAASEPDTDALLDIKQQALQQLTPLVDHLEQTPEEKFRTTMMMIQAADNHELVKAAYEAAQQITDEKARAQALLDIVNEINYFTHNNAASSSEAA